MKVNARFLTLSLTLLFLTSTVFIISSCNDDETNAPSVSGFSPTSGVIGTAVTINGTNFGATVDDNEVMFNGTSAEITSATTTELVVTVPANATTGKITVTVNDQTATSTEDFTVLGPTITDFTPTSGVVGDVVTINGSNFSSVSSENTVLINGETAEVTNSSVTQITAVVPATATTGKISVTANGKTATSSSDFTVSAPTITTYFPAIAAVGRTVVITGTNFSSVTNENIVKFNGTAATVTQASATELTVTVPNGATTGTLTVKVGPNTATSAGNFEICSSAPEIVISNIVIANTSGATSYTVSFTLTNVGSVDADAAKLSMQNYASVNQTYDGGDVAASGYGLSAGGILSPGEAFTYSNYVCNIVGGNTTSHPYLIITIYDSPDGSVPECNTTNNIAVKAFNP